MKAVFLDRDGTINCDKKYLFKREGFEYLCGVKDALKCFSDAGFLLIIITNQSGIARGFYTEHDYSVLTDWMLSDLKNDGIEISAVYFCPHHPKASILQYKKDCDCRKPKTGLFLKAVADYKIDLSQSYAIGDKERDVAICKESDCKGFVLYSGKNERVGNVTYINGGLKEACDILLGDFKC